LTRKWLALSCAVACASTQATAPEPAHRAPSTALIPDVRVSSSELRVVERDPSVSLSDVDTCATCHSDVAEQWKTSAHFFASFDNPIYRAAVLRFRKERGNAKSQFCGGCHDPSLAADGAMDHEIATDDLRAFSGVTCRTCHGTIHARADGNASLDVRVASIELPKDGDAASVERHKVAAAPSALRTAGLCIGCHRVFLDEGTGNAHHLAGQDEGTPWMRSAYAGSAGERVDENVAVRDCRGCHMPKEDAKLGDAAAKNGTITSHRFLGGHTWLASMRGDSAALEREKKLLETAATIDIVGARLHDSEEMVMLPAEAKIQPGDRVVVDVVVKNVGTGHRFPGGTLDAQDTWVEIRVFDARGLIAIAGDTHEKGEPTFNAGTHVLRAVILDDGGQPVLARETERFRTTVVNHTIAPRDAAVVRYALDLPKASRLRSGGKAFDGEKPLRFEARLRHRTRSLAVQDASCAQSGESLAYDVGLVKSYAFVKPLDPCKAQPIIDIAVASSELGPGASARDASKDFDRAYAWGQGSLHMLLEDLDEARGPLLIADHAARNPTEHAMALALLGQLAAKEGRTDEAFAHLADAERAIGPHPFFDRIRGEVLASVWRNDEAAPYTCNAAGDVLRDDGLYSELAVALGSVRKAPYALEAARYALALQPRDEGALRVQALSLESMGAPIEEVRRAKDAWLARRSPDDGASIKARCSATVSGCAAERNPVRMHPMTGMR